ncbi:MAG TPA: von Willebrand factor type A domain-containing protein [Rariglobus sp.]|nr:von Willebrand factor type A domain-containing protein [Rariglobus sp.]
MNNINETLSSEDPLITAYAFGELEGEELIRVETAVKNDPALQAAVAELCAFGGQLTTSLAGEQATEKSADGFNASSAQTSVPKRRAWLIPFPVYYLATAAAACFAVVVWVRNETYAPMRFEAKRSAPMMSAMRLSGPEPAPMLGAASGSLAVVEKDKAASQAFDAKAFVGKIAPGEAPLAPLQAPAAGSAKNNIAAQSAPDASLAAVGGAQDAYMGKKTESGMRLDYGLVQTAAKLPQGSNGAGREATVGGYMDTVSLAPASGFTPASVSANESYAYQTENDYHSVANDPLSTFSIDVDTASYANVRRFITGGTMPPRDAVRVEELVNYFPYAYTPPSSDVPFAAHLAVASAPWAPAHRLVRIALKGKVFNSGARPAANLVFLLDVSGSMNSANKLPLVKESLRLLVERLHADDHVAIVTYASGSGLALPSTSAAKKRDILAALDNLHADGSTNGAMGIQLAYDVAKANFVTGGINRVILCTDGDFNVGITNQGDLVNLIQEKAKSRVFLSVFGFGMGNYKDSTLELLADKGNGAYGYIDTRREAEKVFVEQAEGTLATIAKDVKIQVEFNPARVQSYRLIGYENRLLKKEDFNNDAVDAGEIGAGHTVTALYEVVPVGVDADGMPRPEVDPLKYQKSESDVKTRSVHGVSPELLTVKVRYKAPEGDVSRKLEFPLVDAGADFAKADGDFQFAAAVAGWGMLLRDSPHKGTATFPQVLNWAENGLGDDAGGYRAEFIQLVRRSMELSER